MPKVQTLKDIIVKWLKSSEQLKAFTVGQNITAPPDKPKWFIWYHVWAKLEIKDDRVVYVGGWCWDTDILAADPKFFKTIEQYLLNQKISDDDWLAKRGRSVNA